MAKEELLCCLVPMMDTDPDYQQALRKLEKVEPDYLALLETLTPEQRDVLERYIAACEEVDDALLFLAYEDGRKNGFRMG